MTTPLGPRDGVLVIDRDYATNTSRLENTGALTQQLERCFEKLDRGTLLARLAAAGVPAGRLRGIDEVYEREQTRSQGLTISEHGAPPLLDADGPAIRSWLR